MCCPDVNGEVFWNWQKSFATLVTIFQTAEVVTVAIAATVKENFTSADKKFETEKQVIFASKKSSFFNTMKLVYNELGC
jgi:hypothetical protein